MRKLILAAAMVLIIAGSALAQEAREAEAPVMEVVFVLDTTGSMSGLIEGAKQKIWSIISNIADGEPAPVLKIGLVAYRDKGDDYITSVVDLSDNLDKIFMKLTELKADGGGDTPESVNRALYHAVTKISWSKDEGTMREIFLVGDSPPHLDYHGEVKYPKSCRKAVDKSITINTVLCGSSTETEKIWQEIAGLADGVYVKTGKSGGISTVPSPYDEDMIELACRFDDTVVPFGTAAERRAALKQMVEMNEFVKEASKVAAADRAVFKAARGHTAAGVRDLVTEIEMGRLDVEEVERSHLPAKIRNMTEEARWRYLDRKIEKRAAIRNKIETLSEKRNDHIDKELEKLSKDKEEKTESFDKIVIEALKRSAASRGISYDKKKDTPEKETPLEALKRRGPKTEAP